MAKSTKTKTPLGEMTFDELVEMTTHRIHSGLLEGGGRGMKSAVHMWLQQAILWSQEQVKNNP